MSTVPTRPDGPPEPGTWRPDGDRPLVLRLAERRPFVLVLGLALMAAAVLVVRQVVLYPESVRVSVAVAVVLLTVVVAFLGGLGVLTVRAFVRAPRQTMTVGPDGLSLGAGTLRLDWADLEAVAVHVDAVRPASTHLMPKGPASSVTLSLLWCPRAETDDAGRPAPLARLVLPEPFTHERLLSSVPFTADLDVPVARDLDTALHHFAGPAYRPPVLPGENRGGAR
ncbi:hypothetical protein JOE63_000384 [Cellulosimicrobium cellulans]|uniref:Uncharacterized protein n=1 Tax=Cellulosimicrobium cellulans TaxID=1710 RepID=A0A1Y0HTI0_CELCE|nr:hypothetical protein [Cellulosimicrobium cellulans]ARU51457.1 hypothetical protein CBR64_08170 [Cellulosimicrobium cellulans]MBM7817907.1 hypothetical protein [Cellulosimicrobium cellulans]